MLVVLAILILLLILPTILERAEFALVRGRERARAEVAREELAQMPDAVERYRTVAKSIRPCVVGVVTMQDDEWSQAFGEVRAGLGSGVIMDAAGYIVTNCHVIDQAAKVTVRLADGSSVPAKVVEADPVTDLAVLKIESQGLTAAPWGDSDKLEVGDQVMAVGSPFGLDQTVTAGIVSAKDRREQVENARFRDFLQTDAAVNPGNSGGPLVNMKGEVVGINTAIVGPTYRGISFAIPSRLAQTVYERLKTSRRIEARGWLGVAMVDVNESVAEQLGLEGVRGVLVWQLVPGSPAEKAGIRRGDVILRWNKEPVESSAGLSILVGRSEIGSKAILTLSRKGKETQVTVTVGERPSRTE
jgi:serine protease Do